MKAKVYKGLCLTEMMVAITAVTFVILATGILLANGQKAWDRTYTKAHAKMQQEALNTIAAFTSTGRKANRLDYTVYQINDGTFIEAVPSGAGEEEVYGNAVEFRFWDVPLSITLLDVTITGTAYALFYLYDDTLKMDIGPCPPGAVPSAPGARNTSGIVTRTLATNVSVGDYQGAFSHTTLGTMGQGCVRLHVVLTNPDDGESQDLAAAALMRNMWPR